MPLRPLGFGTLFTGSFQVLRRNPRPTFGAALLLVGLVQILSLAIVLGPTIWGLERVLRASPEDSAAIEIGNTALTIVASLFAVALSLVASALLQGLIVIEVSRATLGDKLTMGQLFRRGRGRWGALIGWTALLSLALVAAIVILVAVVALMISVGETAGLVGGVILGIGGGLGMLVLAIWIGIKTALVPTAIVLERLPLRASVARSWRLTGGRFWRTFGILALITVIVQTASSAVATPFSIAAGLGIGLVNPAQDETTALIAVGVLYVVTIIVTIVVGAIGAVLLSAATGLVYIDARMRDEGLDLDLQRFVEERAAGRDGPDPYQERAAQGLDGAAPSPQVPFTGTVA
ncbi:glycerophosphoryl diester phosphodiesterase membrane domain-containing protein [Microcella daejeonensis]|uniref:glycerophosphoryl diester phosphodiesterase membrane domain-containing protein n=1 Tax=Microcella daejeonensis TaxID=2994971 RepID=UPI00226F15F3|nr:glycerophosphoryl diester phosphodiesterase membrane domain-containing protein [Microcella daejeonensis]WAB83999.1 glycerophosphoryl diester phosphodiesterase membrane domain-containing protein [Microcella daejeonensis]